MLRPKEYVLEAHKPGFDDVAMLSSVNSFDGQFSRYSMEDVEDVLDVNLRLQGVKVCSCRGHEWSVQYLSPSFSDFTSSNLLLRHRSSSKMPCSRVLKFWYH